MDTTPATTVLGALVVVLIVVTVTTAVLAARSRRRAAADVAAARAETARLAARVDALGAQLVRPAAGPPGAADAAYVITDAGTSGHGTGDGSYDARPMVRDTYVLNAALGEPLVKAVALGHGVRRALSAESRARIRVAVRHETRRARKQRRREMREVWLAHKRAARTAPASGPATGTADAA